jgi:hypothetical protein
MPARFANSICDHARASRRSCTGLELGGVLMSFIDIILSSINITNGVYVK